MAVGRPRTFDEAQALDLAVEVFWRQGYEGTSITDLTTAMGMNKPSLYTVFGSKEKLFRLVVARYAERDMGYKTAALAEPTAAAVARTLLLENAKALTRKDQAVAACPSRAACPAVPTTPRSALSSPRAGWRASRHSPTGSVRR
ncbi:TetR/AcrR family transcriptional regulator [Streptomyces kaempferi]